MEQFANDAVSELAAGINASVTTLDVVDGTKFPSTGNFRIRINNEYIIVGARAGATLSSLTRGAEGSTAAAHSAGDRVTAPVTKGQLDNLAQVAKAQTFTEDQTIEAVNALLLGDVGAVQAHAAGANGALLYQRNARFNGTSYVRTLAENDAALFELANNGDLVFWTNSDAGNTVGSTITWGEKFRISKDGTIRTGVSGGPAKLWLHATASVSLTTGAGTPEGSIVAQVGSIHLRTDGGASTTFYVKETGVGNTGWVAK